MDITNLRCCLLTNPRGVDRRLPELSWELVNPSPGSNRQTAYRVRVATSADRLDDADLWDSGRVESDRTFFLIYDGCPLSSRMDCHWRVEVWDESGRAIWSEVATWTMGLLEATDWSAQWIGLDAAPEYERSWFGNAQWIWAEGPASAERVFAGEFEIAEAENLVLAEGELRVLVDAEAEVFLNDQPLCRAPRARAETNNWAEPIPYWIGRQCFRVGANTLRIRARPRPGLHGAATGKTGGVMAQLKLHFGEGRSERSIVTDRSWSCRGENGETTTVIEQGAFGSAPWHLVSPQEFPKLPARYARTEIDLPSAPQRAVLYFSGLGLSEAFINGHKVNDEVLSPNPTDYERRVLYRTIEVGGLLRPGRNALAALLGNGRYFAPRKSVPVSMHHYGCPKMIWQLEITLEDGTKRRIVSSPEWRISTEGPVGWNNEFDGEQYDARVDFSGWDKPGFDDSGWHPAALAASPGGVLRSQLAEPLRVIQRISPLASWRTKYNTTLYDFGENISGWCHIRAEGKPGARIRLVHAETLEGSEALFTDNLRSASCCDTIVMGPDPLDYEPRFTIHGFQYVEVREEVASCDSFEIEACVVHDDIKITGEFACSNPTINSIVAAARRGILGNYRGMPLDCPQRDERMGWLGDRAVGAAGEMFFFDVAAFYRKWLADIRDAQLPNGCVPDVAPPYWRFYSDNVTWPSCLAFVPFWLHRHYGDEPEAVRNFPALRRWIDHMLSLRQEEGLIERDVYGDWCVPPESPNLIHSELDERKTPGPLVSSCYGVRVLELGAGFADLAGCPADAERWRTAAGTMRQAINDRYFNRELGLYANGSQTASLLPVAFGIVPPEEHDRVFQHIVSGLLQSNEPLIGTGLIGTGWLMRTLTSHGRADLACAIAARKEYPGWGYMIGEGATTIWELWNGNTADPAMNSRNHVMLLGDLLPWLFEDLAGIQPDEAGFRQIHLRPVFPAMLDFVTASCRTMSGEIRSNWQRQEEGDIELL